MHKQNYVILIFDKEKVSALHDKVSRQSHNIQTTTINVLSLTVKIWT